MCAGLYAKVGGWRQGKRKVDVERSTKMGMLFFSFPRLFWVTTVVQRTTAENVDKGSLSNDTHMHIVYNAQNKQCSSSAQLNILQVIDD